MTGWRKALSITSLCALVAGGAAAWSLTPATVHADTPMAVEPTPRNPWAEGPVDRGNMVQGVLDYRTNAPASFG